MVIKPSASTEIRLLVEALSSGDDVRRDAAAARLVVIGPRAVARLLTAYARASTDDARVIILRVIEPMKDARAMAPARGALRQGGAIGLAAAHVIRGLLTAPEAGVRAGALDALVEVALDAGAPADIRRAVAGMLDGLPEAVRAAVAGLPDPGIDPVPDSAPSAVKSVWTAALDGELPERAAALREAFTGQAAAASLTVLQKLVDALKTRETTDPEQGSDWAALRGTVHHALAMRGSRVALYDLRESFAAATAPLPVSFLSAVHEVGDASCLEPLARAYARAAVSEEWWRGQLVAAFRAIVQREKLTKRSAVLKAIEKKWPDVARRVSP